MKPLFVLLGTFALSCLIMKLSSKGCDFRLAGRLAMAGMLIFTAIGHFVFKEGMTSIVPSYIPFKSQMVIITGILEFLFAIALLFPIFQRQTAWVLIAFLLLILPANVYASIHKINYQTGAIDGPGLNYLWFRVPLQMFYILWIYFSAAKQ